jgi:hypothetical protein
MFMGLELSARRRLARADEKIATELQANRAKPFHSGLWKRCVSEMATLSPRAGLGSGLRLSIHGEGPASAAMHLSPVIKTKRGTVPQLHQRTGSHLMVFTKRHRSRVISARMAAVAAG